MTVYELDPLRDPRWQPFALRHPDASAFHSVGWLGALKDAYGYEPAAYTTCAPDAELRNGIVFCKVNSWLTGRRLVSLPFSDHCQPLAEVAEAAEILDRLRARAGARACRYLEIRPISFSPEAGSRTGGMGKAKSYWLNLLSLEPSLDALFAGFHKSCVQRVIKRSAREGVRVEAGTDPVLLRKFYGLLLKTRRRHQLPPQPLSWFESLVRRMGDSLRIWVASKEDLPVSAILTLSHRDTIIYKYGCSDERHFNLGGIFALFWEMIQEAKKNGARTLDLGRSDLDGQGLIQFKDRWGSRRAEISYYRFPAPPHRVSGADGWKSALAHGVVRRLPDPILILVGKALYRHTG